MNWLFDRLETVSDRLGSFGNYLNSTRVCSYVYGTGAWNTIRKQCYGTYKVDRIISIGESCETNADEVFCYHLVRYEYNGVIQEEVFDSQQIMNFCAQTGYPLTEHFSLGALVKNNKQFMISQRDRQDWKDLR